MGGKWVPGVSLIGLACVMCLPTPGVVGVAVGGGCLLAIAVWAVMFAIGFVLSMLASPFVRMIRPSRKPRRRRKDFHPGSGIPRRIARPEPDAAAAGEARAAEAPAPGERPIEIRRAPRRSREDAGPVRKMRTSEA